MIKILAIDDLQDNLTTFKAVVREVLPDCTILTALNGLQGIELARAEDPDVILLDIVMPGMDGFAVCRRLKADERLRSIPVIFLTALRTDRESRVKALEVGAEAFLSKPMDEQELVAQVRAMVKLKTANRLQRMEKEELAALVTERTQELERELEARKQTGAALQKSLSVLAATLESTADGILVVDAAGTISRYNQKFLEMWGIPKALAETKNDEELLRFILNQLKDPELFLTKVRELYRTPEAISMDEIVLNGVRIFERYSQPQRLDQTIVGRVWSFRDITERKQAEEAIKKSEEKFSKAFNTCPEVMMISTLEEGRFIEVNDAFLKKTGFQRNEVVGHTSTELNLWVDWNRRRQFMIELSKNGFVRNFEAQFRMRTGEVRDFLTSSEIIDVVDKRCSLNFILDVTDRKRMEEMLLESHDQLVKLTAQVPGVVYQYRLYPDGRSAFPFASPGMKDIYEVTPEEVREDATPVFGRLHPDDHDRVSDLIQESARTLKPFHCEFRVLLPRQGLRWRLSDALPERMKDGGTLWHGIISDITERKLLEDQLRQAQKLESIGQLAGGVAHDYNNLLASTMMNLGMLRENPNHDEETRGTLHQLALEAQRAANLTRQLLLFSRRSVMEVKVLDLNELVANLLKMLGRLIGENITIEFDHGDHLPLVEADSGMLEQVIMNLAVNARDAMAKGGRLTFSIEATQVDAERIKGNVEVRPGQFVCLSVTDTGCGMDEATQKRIFEPFFTTKEVGKGTGLGLATTYGIVAQHKGWVEVESELGKGSTFKVFLPATTKETSAPVAVGQTVTHRGQETILLVEDDAPLRVVAVRVLSRMGYRILEADNGLAAMKLWQDYAGQIDLLFSDMVMPEGLTGLDLAEKLRAKKPSLKVIITSGYNADLAGQATPTAGGIRYLQKPYPIEILSKVVRECLDNQIFLDGKKIH